MSCRIKFVMGAMTEKPGRPMPGCRVGSTSPNNQEDFSVAVTCELELTKKNCEWGDFWIKSYHVLKLFSIFNINANHKNFLLRPFIIKISIVMRCFVCFVLCLCLPCLVLPKAIQILVSGHPGGVNHGLLFWHGL